MTTETMSEGLQCSVDEYVATVTVNRPERRNALDSVTQRAIVGLMSDLSTDATVRVIVLTGAGDRAFSAGADLKEVDEIGSSGQRLTSPMAGLYRNVFEAVLEVPKPTVAAINGFAVAGGLELALACDLRFCSENAVFGMPEAKIGMGGNFASVLLPRLIPRAVALEMLYTGERIDAKRAHEIGLVNGVFPAELLKAEAHRVALAIARNAPLSTRRYKEMSLKGWEMPVASALRLDVGPNPYDSYDRAEGIRAFLEGRPAKFENR